MRVAMVGGTGFLGPTVVERLTAAGHEVVLLHRGTAEEKVPSTVRHIHADRRDLRSQRDAFSAFAPDVAVDMRPMTEADAIGFVETFVGVAPRAVVISSADVYRAYGRLNLTEPGPPDPVPLGEGAPKRELLYADRDARPHDKAAARLDDYDKILVERVLRDEPRLRTAVLRLGMVHGPRSYRHYPWVKRMLDGRPGIVLASSFALWRGTLAYSENVAAAIALAATRSDTEGAYNVGEASPIAMRDVVAGLAAVAGWRGRIATLPAARLPEVMRPGAGISQDLVLDTSRMRAELGYREDITWEDGLRRTVGWMKAHPPGADQPMGQLTFDYAAEDALLAQA